MSACTSSDGVARGRTLTPWRQRWRLGHVPSGAADEDNFIDNLHRRFMHDQIYVSSLFFLNVGGGGGY